MHCAGHLCRTPKHPSSFPGMESGLRIIDPAMCSQVCEGAKTAQIKAGRQPAPSIDRNGTCSLGASPAEGRRWKDGTSSQSIRLPRCPIPYGCCRLCYRFRLLLAVPGCLCDALLRSLLLPGPSGSNISITFFISSHFRIIHLPAAALIVLKAICSVLGIVCIFLVTVLLKAGGDIFHAFIMGGVHIHSCLRALFC